MGDSLKTKKIRKIPLILDTDMAPDSWVAVLFAALHPGADLLAVSVSGTGETHGKIGARNAQRLLTLAGRTDVPVSFGPPKPLKGNQHFPLLMRFIIDHMMWLKIPKADPSLPIHDSVNLISKILRESKEKITFAVVGPQTNLATVLMKYPDLKSKIKGIYIMGGALDVPGNIKEIAMWKANTTAEWNFFCDPLAAKIVLDSGVPVWLVPLDATNQVPVTQDFITRLGFKDKTPAGEFINSMLHLLVVKLRANNNFYLWDPITTACALDPSLAQFKKRKVDVITEAGHEWGRVADAVKGTNIFAAHTLDREQFEKTIINTVSK
jgi:pyrimidine-specific ribonucleoside hydrolase